MGAQAAEKRRQKGNTCYRDGQLEQAITHYTKAASLDPQEPKPLANLSAAYYEMGLYTESIDMVEKTFQLSIDDPLKTKLTLRLIRSALQTKDWVRAAQGLTHVPEQERVSLSSVCSHTELIALLDKPGSRSQVATQLPRYTPSLVSGSEYYVIGHDKAEAQIDRQMIPKAPSEPLSFFFAGIGDARHMYDTMISIRAFEREEQGADQRRYHFTMNDIKAGPIARDLIVLELLARLGEATDDGLKTEVQATLFFVYIGVVMPSYVHERLQAAIARVINALKTNDELPAEVKLGTNCKASLIQCLESWQGEVDSLYTTAAAIECVRSHNNQTGMEGAKQSLKAGEVDQRCRQELESFLGTGAHWPPTKATAEFEPDLAILLKDTPVGKHSGKVKKYIVSRWRVNPTLLDAVWHRDDTLQFNPYLGIDYLVGRADLKTMIPARSDRLFDFLGPFFLETARAIKELHGRLTIECLMGDMTEVMEHVRYGLTDRPKGFPKLYNRVHMSNIPDYIGGPLATALYSMPLTKLTPSSCATSTCLRNLGSWRTIHDFHNEYLLAPDAATLAKITRMAIIDQHADLIPDPMRWALPLGGYYRWGRTGKGPLPFSSLLPRAALMKWLFAIFFKIALPFNRDGVAFHELILSPLNATVIFRILIHLQHLGYPSHWLSDFLDCILSNNVVTSARPPKTSPLSIAETRRENPIRKRSVTPFMVEMTTLLLIFEPILPFTVMTKDLPPPSAVHEYIITVPRSKTAFPPIAYDRQGWILVFHNTTLWEPIDDEEVFSYCDLRGLLDGSWDPQMNSIEAEDVYKFRDEGLVLVSTFKYDAEAKEATIWMLEDEMDAMLRDGNWMCGLWSTETWKSCQAVKVYEGGVRGVRKVKRWFE